MINGMNPPEETQNHSLVELGTGGLSQPINQLRLSSHHMSEGNNLDKVRDILFGTQIREVDKRFANLEKSLVTEITNFRDEARKRLDALEIYIKKEVESLTQRLKQEQTEREAALQSIVEAQKQTNSSFEKKLSQVDEKSINNQRELREQILNQSKSLQDDIQQKYEEILALLKQESQQLDRVKTDRSTLAALLTEMAISLNADNKY